MINPVQEQKLDRLNPYQTSKIGSYQIDKLHDQLEAEVQQQSSLFQEISNENSIRSRKQNKVKKRKSEDRQDPSYSPKHKEDRNKEDRKLEDWANKLRNMMKQGHKGQRQSLGQFLLTVNKQCPDQMKRICTELKNGYYNRELQLSKTERSSMVGYINQFRKVKKYLPKNIQQAV